ncbi:MAG: orotidine-5'-phosphate decarboxylase [Candidatus Kaelpia aquatica]|nr:orotidine-5'-phosphate decarboxylase [Candidatus Kaelpia aquatica]
MDKREKIIIALDVDSINDMRCYLDMLAPYVKTFKIGPRLFIPYGREAVDLIKSYGSDVFLDLKLHDIPTQVVESVKKIGDLGIKMFTVHAFGGKAMIENSRKALDSFDEKERPLMLAVTLLTSIDENDLHFLGFKNKINSIVYKLAELALTSGADGVVSSVAEVSKLKEGISQSFISVVPGIKIGAANRDQKRSGSPQEAFDNGADYIVIGRSILNADNPVKVVKEVLDE